MGNKPRTKRERLEEDQRRREELLAQLWAQGADLQDIAQTMGMSLTTLSELASDRMFRLTLRRLCELGNMRSRLITSRYRVHAAAKLVALVSDGEGEVARKASVDLLKMGLESPKKRKMEEKVKADPGQTEDSMAGLVEGDELSGAGVLEALRKLGEVRDE